MDQTVFWSQDLCSLQEAVVWKSHKPEPGVMIEFTCPHCFLFESFQWQCKGRCGWGAEKSECLLEYCAWRCQGKVDKIKKKSLEDVPGDIILRFTEICKWPAYISEWFTNDYNVLFINKHHIELKVFSCTKECSGEKLFTLSICSLTSILPYMPRNHKP